MGTISNHAIYGIEESQIYTIPDSTVQTEASNTKAEIRFVSLKVLNYNITMIIWIMVIFYNISVRKKESKTL